jgi:uncharacterized protein
MTGRYKLVGKCCSCLTLLRAGSKITSMVIATCVVTLHLDGAFSLKDKRRIVKSLATRLPQQFNVAVAEVEHQDVWQTAVLGMVTVGNDARYLHTTLQKAVTWIEEQRPDVPIADYSIEII